MAEPPPPLVDIATALTTKRRPISVAGLVVDHLDLFRTRGTSSCITFTIRDSRWDTRTWANGLKIKYFHDDESALPAVRLNDVILLQNLKINDYRGERLGVVYSQDKVPWSIYRSNKDPSADPDLISGPIPIDPSPLEKRAVSAILTNPEAKVQEPDSDSVPNSTSLQRVQAQAEQSSTASQKGYHSFTLVKDAEVGRFGQFIGQVVKDNDFDSDKVILWITDYTSHESLNDFAEEDSETGREGDPHGYLTGKYAKKWPGPWGKMSVQVTLWEPHASYAREHVRPGNFVLLTYVRPKFNSFNGMEFSVSTDRKYPDKVHIKRISDNYDEKAQELMERRKEYWKIHGRPKEEDKEQSRSAKSKKAAGQQKNEKIEESQPRLPTTSSRVKSNENVRYPNNGIPLRSLESIISADTHINNPPGGATYKLPFQNVSYLMQAIVVDYFPPKLEDFAVKVPNKSILHRGNDDMDTDEYEHASWEWRFCLLLEGTDPVINKQQQREQMKVFVSGPEGEHLLDLNPSDLRRDKNCLNNLREKLFILWGNLEECKTAAEAASAQNSHSPMVKLSSRPFTCCIKEYGIPCVHLRDPSAMVLEDSCGQGDCLGWERRFSIAGTTIKT